MKAIKSKMVHVSPLGGYENEEDSTAIIAPSIVKREKFAQKAAAAAAGTDNQAIAVEDLEE